MCWRCKLQRVHRPPMYLQKMWKCWLSLCSTLSIYIAVSNTVIYAALGRSTMRQWKHNWFYLCILHCSLKGLFGQHHFRIRRQYSSVDCISLKGQYSTLECGRAGSLWYGWRSSWPLVLDVLSCIGDGWTRFGCVSFIALSLWCWKYGSHSNFSLQWGMFCVQRARDQAEIDQQHSFWSTWCFRPS